MVQSHASAEEPVFRSEPGFVWLFGLLILLLAAIQFWGQSEVEDKEAVAKRAGISIDKRLKLGVKYKSHDIGAFSDKVLTADGELNLSFGHSAASWSYPAMLDTLKLEWWQIVEREDGHGYPRIDPQSGGSGLPGAKGEDEDPAYYSSENLADSTLRQRIFADGKYWLLDKPSLETSIRCESWLVERTSQKSVTFISGVSWGITARDDKVEKLHHPRQIARRSHYDWHESLRISGFGSGWEIRSAFRSALP